MIAILSPAKRMKLVFNRNYPLTTPIFLKEARYLHSFLKNLQPADLEGPLKINPDLAMKAFCDYQTMTLAQEGTQSILTYYGLQYQNLNSQTFTEEDFMFANNHLKITSALYGLLSPSDKMEPYRLDMESKLKFNDENLYQFWGDKIYKALYHDENCIVNLASMEYAKLVIPFLQKEDRFITCQFQSIHKGKKRTLATKAKMARGQMARYVVKNKINHVEDLKYFDWDGYSFIDELSDEMKFVFEQ